MSMQALFEDRRKRKSLRDSVLEGTEIGVGECGACGKKSPLIQVKEYKLCEHCCQKILEGTNDYEKSFDGIDEEVLFHDMIHETYLTFDKQKFTSDAQSKFGSDSRDSYSKLMQSYGLKVHKDFDDRWDKGYLFVIDGDLSSGKTRINQFMIDYSCQFVTARMAQKLVPDADGTLAPVGANVPSNGSSPASVTNTSTKSSYKTNTQTPAGPGVNASGTDTNFEITLADDIVFSVIQAAGSTYSVTYKGSNNSIQVSLSSTKKDDLMKEVVELIKSRPQDFFPAIDKDDFTNGYSIEKYPAYSFLFDAKSFDGKNVSLGLALMGKPYENSRVYITAKELSSRVSLNGALMSYIDDKMKRIYPCIFDGSADVKTSLGKAVSYLIAVNPSSSDKLGEVSVRTEVGNTHFDWKTSGSRLQNKEETKNGVYDILYSGMSKIIPDWNDTKIRSNMRLSSSNGATDSFELTLKNPDMTVFGYFDLNDLYDTGDIALRMSIVDTHSGIEQPKQFKRVVYKKSGISIADFLAKEARDIHKEYFDTSTMSQTLKVSAQDKMKVPSKKRAFLEKVKYNLLRSSDFSSQVKKLLDDFEIDFDDFSINKDGKVTSVIIRVSDPDSLSADDSRELAGLLELDKKLKWLKFAKADSSPKGMSEYGPSVVYTVTDIERFSECSNLALLESMMFEAFDIVKIDESGRKQFYI